MPNQTSHRVLQAGELGNLLRNCAFEKFRIETLSSYGRPGEEDAHYLDYLKGEYVPTKPDLDFIDQIRKDKEAHRSLVVVRTLPPGWFKMPYIRCEIDFYGMENSEAGADIRFLLLAETSPTDIQKIHAKGDFWLLDKETPVEMAYETDGSFVHSRLAIGPNAAAPYNSIRELCLKLALPTREFLQRFRRGDVPL